MQLASKESELCFNSISINCDNATCTRKRVKCVLTLPPLNVTMQLAREESELCFNSIGIKCDNATCKRRE